jgi:hypothetical protein
MRRTRSPVCALAVSGHAVCRAPDQDDDLAPSQSIEGIRPSKSNNCDHGKESDSEHAEKHNLCSLVTEQPVNGG